jgi:hypothetical protein
MDEHTFQRRRKELSRDPAWRAVFVIFDRLCRDDRIWQHVDFERETIQFKAILEDGTFSGGELRLVEIAASIFNQEHKINLYWALAGLDEDNAIAVEKAIAAFNDLTPSDPRSIPRPDFG